MLSVVGITIVAAFVLSACQSADSAPNATATAAAIPVNQLKPLADPKSYDGPSTALMADSGIHPIATDPTPALPATITDMQGTQVTVTDASRILPLDLYGSLSRIVFDLGLGKNVIGRDTSTTFPEAANLPVVTANGHTLNAEAILELNPSVIITDTSLGPWDVILQMRDAGIPVVVVDSSRSIDTVAPLITQVANSLGLPDLGQQLADRTTAQVNDVVAQIAAIAPPAGPDRLRIAFLYVRGQANVYYLFGEGSGADSLIDALSGTDVAQEIGWQGMRPVSDEGIVAAQPDVILMMTDGLTSAGGVDGLLERLPAIAQTPAGQHHRIVDMADSQILAYGPTTADVLTALAAAIYAPDSSAPEAATVAPDSSAPEAGK